MITEIKVKTLQMMIPVQHQNIAIHWDGHVTVISQKNKSSNHGIINLDNDPICTRITSSKGKQQTKQ